MARKRKSSGLEDILDVVSLLPWWAGVAIAVIGYFGKEMGSDSNSFTL